MSNETRNFCRNSQTAGRFDFDISGLQKDAIIKDYINRENLNEIESGLNEVAHKGAAKKSYSETLELNHETNFVLAEDIQKIIDFMGNISDENKPEIAEGRIEKDQIIYAEDFRKIFDKLNNIKYRKDACDSCNSYQCCDDAP